MNSARLIDFAQMTMVIVIKLSLVPIVVATVIGLVVSLLQALTQVQEQTLGFAVKLIAITLTLLAAGSWIGSEMLLFSEGIFNFIVEL